MNTGGLPTHGLRLYEVERRIHALLSADPPLEQGWPDTLWPVLPDEALAAARTAMAQFAHLNGFVKPHSLQVIEAELLKMVRSVLDVPDDGHTTLTVGGTESNFLAVKAALFRARGGRPDLRSPNMVLTRTAHPSFDKAGSELGVAVRRVEPGKEYRADVNAMAQAMDEDTVLLVGSTPTYTHGTLDPIPELARLAEDRGVWLHVDACVGGFLLPHLRRVGELPWEPGFRNSGVASVAADLHKLGFTPTGISTLSVRNKSLADHHGFTLPIAQGWPFRDYARAGFSGSRSGAVLAGAWATLLALGQDGYDKIARGICAAGEQLSNGISRISGLTMVAPPECGVLVFSSTDAAVPIELVARALEDKGWPPALALEPPRLQILLSPLPSDYYEVFLAALDRAVEAVRSGAVTAAADLSTYGDDSDDSVLEGEPA